MERPQLLKLMENYLCLVNQASYKYAAPKLYKYKNVKAQTRISTLSNLGPQHVLGKIALELNPMGE